MRDLETRSDLPPDTPLPFDPRTLCVRIEQRWGRLVAATVLAGAVGVGAGLSWGSREYEAATMLLYRPTATEWTSEALPLPTQMNLVKLRSNLETVGRRLGLNSPLDLLGQAIEVRIQRDSDLLAIMARLDDPTTAAAIANETRDVFLTNQGRIRVRESLRHVAQVLRHSGDQRLLVEAQVARLDRIMASLSARDARRRHEPGGIADLGELTIRIQRTREAILEDRALRTNEAKLHQLARELKQATQLADQGMLAPSALDALHSEYEVQRAVTVDTEQVAAWREELDRLQSTVLPARPRETPSSQVVQQVMFTATTLELEQVGVDEQVAQLVERQRRLQAQSAALDLEGDTPAAVVMADPTLTDFRVVATAKGPVIPTRSNRRALAAQVALGVLTLLAGLVCAVEVLSSRLRSGAELLPRTGLDLLGTLPVLARQPSALTEIDDAGIRDRFRIIGGRVRALRPDHGARILVTSSQPGEGVSAVVVNLAGRLGQQQERVLIIDATLPEDSRPGHDPGRSTANPLTHATATALPNVDVISASAVATTHDLLGAPVMARLLGTASERYDVVLIAAPAAGSCADATLLSRHVDGIVLVVASQVSTVSQIKAARARLEGAAGHILGAIFTQVEPAFDTGT